MQYFGKNTLKLKVHIHPRLHQCQNSLYLVGKTIMFTAPEVQFCEL